MVNNNLKSFRPNTNKEKFSFTGSGQTTVQRSNDISQSTKVVSVSGETLTIAAGAAGTTGKVRLEYAPIMDSIGGKLGYYRSATDSDTSVSITHAAIDGDEIPFDEYLNETELYALLDNGEYTIDYTNGIVYYKKGASDTAGTIDYKYTSQILDASGATLEVNITAATDSIVAHGTYNATEPTLSDGDKASLQLNEAGELKVTGGAGASSVNAEYISPADFSATYTSASTITLSGLPITVSNSAQVAYIKQVKADNTSRTYVNGANEITIAFAANVLTVYEKGAVITSLASGDVYEVGINGQVKSYDPTIQAQKNSITNPEWERYTDPEVLVTAQDLTATEDDLGAVIDVRGYNRLGLFIVKDVNNSEDVDLSFYGLTEADGAVEFDIDGLSSKELWTTGASDGSIYYEIDVGTIPFIQLRAVAGTVGATAGNLTVDINKKWRN